MSLIQNASLTPIQQANLAVMNAIQNMYTQNVQGINIAFKTIWQNRDQVNCSPDLMWASFGANAVSIRHAFQGMIQLLTAANPAYVAPTEPSNWTVTENSDGTITAVNNS